MSKIIILRTLVLGFFALTFSDLVQGEETHIFLGSNKGLINPEYRESRDLPVSLGDGFLVVGYLKDRTKVRFSGDELKLNAVNGVALSDGEGFQIGGGRGTIIIDYPSGIGVIEIVYHDTSSIPPSNGCDLTVESITDRISLKTLNVQLGGDSTKRVRTVKQFFQPFFSGKQSSISSKIKLTAYGYDDLFVERISFYSTYDIASNTTFLDGATGKKTSIIAISTGEEYQLQNKLVYEPLEKFERKLASSDAQIESKRKLAEYFHELGYAYLRIKEWDRAITYYNKALIVDPDFAKAYINRGFTYRKKGQYQQALQDLNKAISLNPERAGAYAERGIVYKNMKKYDRAIRDCDKATYLDSKNVSAYINRGNVYLIQGKPDAAIRDYTVVINVDSKSQDIAIAYGGRGEAYQRKKQFDLSLRDFNKAISINPEYARVYYYRAIIWYNQKDFERAWADVEKCRKLGLTPNAKFIEDLKKVSGR